MFNNVATLIKVEPNGQDEYGNPKDAVSTKEIFVKEKSIGQREFYEAAQTGLKPTIKLELADYFDYENEKLVEYDGEKYTVLRTYKNSNRLELILEKKVER